MPQPALEAAPEDREVVRLRREIAGLERELQDAKQDATEARNRAEDSLQAIFALRKQLTGLFNALKMVFGEISRVKADEVDSAEPGEGSRTDRDLWAERIAKAGRAEGRVLQVLLDGGGPMSLAQVRAAAGTGSNTSTYLAKLYAKNWVQKTGHGFWSLK